MADIEIRHRRGHVLDATVIIHAIVVRDVLRSAEDVQHRRVQRLQRVLAEIHRGHAYRRFRIEDAAVLDDDGAQTLIARDLQCLQATAGKARDSYCLGVDATVEIAALA